MPEPAVEPLDLPPQIGKHPSLPGTQHALPKPRFALMMFLFCSCSPQSQSAA
jgi:hypothetical protein